MRRWRGEKEEVGRERGEEVSEGVRGREGGRRGGKWCFTPGFQIQCLFTRRLLFSSQSMD